MLRGLVLLTMGMITGVCTAGWAPTSSPLMTRWAKEVSPENAWPDYPRPQFAREQWKNLNGLWDIALREDALAEKPVFNRQILVPFPVEAPLSGIGERANHVLYRKAVSVPKDWKDQRVLLHFDAVDWQTSVTLNGKLLKTLDGDETHQGGYDRFSYDITDALVTSGTNELLVSVFDPTEGGNQPRGKQVTKSHGIWYTPTTGIWQSVWMEPVSPQGSLRRVQLTPNAAEGMVNIKTHCLNAVDGSLVEIAIRLGKEESEQAVITMGPNEEADFKIPAPHLWSPEDPHLYQVEARLKVADTVIDRVKTYFGLRDIAIKKVGEYQRIFLNGKEIFQTGPLDQGFWPDGVYTAPTRKALVWDIDYARELGFNMIRKHIKVEPDHWYYHCDKVGMLVWQDAVNGEMKTPDSHVQFERDLHRMIDNHWNSPSIVLWVVFNEGWGQYDTERLTAEVKAKDPTRLVTNPSGWVDKGVGDTNDMHQYPGPGAPEPDARRASVLGEFGGLGLFIDGHSWGGKLWGYQGTSDAADFTRRFTDIMSGIPYLHATRGLCASVYTQITDVEIEANGLVTYDREIKKMDSAKVRALNESLRKMAPITVLAATAINDLATTWSYTFEKPADDWTSTSLSTSDWKTTTAGFGRMTKRIFGKVGTEWNTSDIWLRREVELPAGINVADLQLIVGHADDTEIYINGIKAADAPQFVTGYKPLAISAEAQAVMRPGEKNLIAVHCHKDVEGDNKEMGQYIDVGLILVTP